MAVIVKADVLAFAPELSTLTDAAWADVLAYVNTFDISHTGEDAQTVRMARIFFAAHMGTMDKRASSSSAGPVTSESAGGVRRSYGLLASFSGANSLSSTRYGQLYADLLSMSLANGPMLV